ncbi:hypothetical protein FKP32DRAFT_1585545, partial [Trametes sanguinea]
AILTTVGVFRWGYDPEVGNFVPKGATASARIPESRIQNEPNYLCQFSYGIDTHRDKHVWHAQKAFEDYVQSLDGFNKAQKSRRTWQDGSTANNTNSVYTFMSQVFIKRTPTTRHRERLISFELHDWIKQATGPNSSYFANPDRPMLFELRDGELHDIKTCDPPYLRTGDLLWISFGVEFIIGADIWSSTFVPYEIVRVGTVSPDLVGDAIERPSAMAESIPRPRLQVGMKVRTSTSNPALYLILC